MKTAFIHDIVQENGKTTKENNLEKKHNIPVGTLVEIYAENVETHNCRLYIREHRRDCDGNPLYTLGLKNAKKAIAYGHHEGCLKIIKEK